MIVEIIRCDFCDEEIPSVYNRYGDICQTEGILFNYEHYCDSCMSEHLVDCWECGETMYREDAIDGYCEYCYEQTIYDFRKLHDYHDSPDLEPLGGQWGDRLYGLEVEMEEDGDGYRKDCIRDINDVTGDIVFFQRDGSLNCGMELITFPATLEYHMNSMRWDEICKIAKKHEFRSHDTSTCGLHIHVSKNALGESYDERDLVIAKLMIIIEKHWDKVVKFSRRDIEALEEWAKKPSETFYEHDDIETIIDKSKNVRFDRYSAINIKPSETIEFRIFKGTLKASTILASIQFVDTLIDYVQMHTLEEVFQATFKEIVSSDFVELNNYLIERGL